MIFNELCGDPSDIAPLRLAPIIKSPSQSPTLVFSSTIGGLSLISTRLGIHPLPAPEESPHI